MQIFIKTPSGKTITLEIENGNMIDDIKQQIMDLEGVPINRQKLLFFGKQLENNKLISYYNIEEDSTLYLVLRLMR